METITLELRRDTPSWQMPVVPDNWHRVGDDRIVATYDAEALAYALACVGKTREAFKMLTEIKRDRKHRAESLQLRGFSQA